MTPVEKKHPQRIFLYFGLQMFLKSTFFSSRSTTIASLVIHIKKKSSVGDAEKITWLIYFICFPMTRSFWVDNTRLFHFFNSVCHVCQSGEKTDHSLMYPIAWAIACSSLHILLLHCLIQFFIIGHAKTQFNYWFFLLL